MTKSPCSGYPSGPNLRTKAQTATAPMGSGRFRLTFRQQPRPAGPRARRDTAVTEPRARAERD
eukprot:2282690-Heterocapsa_arctica.AAC.1